MNMCLTILDFKFNVMEGEMRVTDDGEAVVAFPFIYKS